MACFGRVVKDVARRQGFQGKFQSSGLRALQQASEEYMEAEFEGVNYLTAHAKRVTVMPKDFVTWKSVKRVLGVKL